MLSEPWAAYTLPPCPVPNNPLHGTGPRKGAQGCLPIDFGEPQADREGQVRGLPVLTLPAQNIVGKATYSQKVDILNQKGGLATCIFTNVLFV